MYIVMRLMFSVSRNVCEGVELNIFLSFE